MKKKVYVKLYYIDDDGNVVDLPLKNIPHTDPAGVTFSPDDRIDIVSQTDGYTIYREKLVFIPMHRVWDIRIVEVEEVEIDEDK